MEDIPEEPILSPYSTDDERTPETGLNILRSLDKLRLNVPLEFGGLGIGDNSDSWELLNELRKIGAYDLSIGRIFEGHVNAVLLLSSYASHEQKIDYYKCILNGSFFGVWNSQLPSEPLRYRERDGKFVLQGGKVFCSGAGFIDRPIVTAEGSHGCIMIVLHMDEMSLDPDFVHWRPMGMKSSLSCRFDFTEQLFTKDQILGSSHDYFREPDFTSGAARFAAVQLGGADAAIDTTVAHLKRLDRTDSPDQVRRMGKLSILRESGNLWLRGAGDALDRRYSHSSECVTYTNMFRTVTRTICEESLKICEKSVGLQGMMAPHPLERIHRDLSVYLKQPGPDSALNQIGKTFTL